MKKSIFFLLTLGIAFVVSGQTIREDIAKNPDLAGGIYTAYTVTEQHATPAPRGYKPFYISHYGRHGSRYQTAAEKYTQPLEIFEQAAKDNRLTDLGRDALRRVRIMAEDAYLRNGDLTRRGEDEHRGIAERMVETYPQVFSCKKANHVTCFSTQSVRAVLSMAAFTERLKELRPSLDVSRSASAHDFCFTKPDEGLNQIYKKARSIAKEYQKEQTDDEQFIRRLFTDYDYAKALIRKVYNISTTHAFMGNMHDLAIIIQNCETLDGLSLHDLFTESERFQMWHLFNIRRYLSYGPSADFGDLRNSDGKPLLRDIIERADRVIAGETPAEAATLRFGHDAYIIPLLALLHVEGCDGRISFSEIERLPEVWCDSRVTSMSVNVQFVFFRNRQGDVLVKLLHSEREVRIPLATDCFPFYKWEDFRRYCVALYQE